MLLKNFNFVKLKFYLWLGQTWIIEFKEWNEIFSEE